VSRTANGAATSIDAALAQAVAELLDIDPEKVDLRLQAPGLDEVRGRVELRLDIEEPPAELGQRTGEDGMAVAAPRVRGERGRGSGGRGADRERADEERDGGDRGRGDAGRDEPTPVTPEQLEEEADAAADFLEGLLDALDLPGDLRITIHDDHAELEIVEIGSGALIGRRGQTLEAIQELVRCTLQRQFQRRSRIKIDAEGYRARRMEKLVEKAEEAIDAALDTGEPQRLEPMDVFERKTVHHMVAEVDGLVSRSQGREPARRVVIEPE
jgi:spoIIIJ-associated protein